MKAYIFPGQGSQFSGMGRDLYEQYPAARALFDKANEWLGFNITQTMFTGTDEELKQTNVTQPAIFLHSVAIATVAPDFQPEMVAGHSLGEFSALVANKVLAFEDALLLVAKRAQAMQKACEANPSAMAAILGLDDRTVEEVCSQIENEIVVAANYNSPGQLVISGSNQGVALACEKLKVAGAKRALPLPVGGAFHSPLMQPAEAELAEAIKNTKFNEAICPVYQNVDARPYTDPEQIKQNLIKQLTAPVRWTQTVQNMITDGATLFVECGPGKVLQGLVKKINKDVEVTSAL
ncbi:[acyl-carrier-protein] S-malonyltransferase [Adhaeribacter arboris]|uniref:Malonyl CoA-acyl carrier protein transacylase n=1 Tax=Adhaeribacter arboris TaxID=2072846 RepID=A0A2T2YDD7_9BACT|nr:ACP S-malonyltransferase [Adhaeribacter arboris]PSR53514.1 [acyl-carrier-protein] S-malonyltransferase [Adhaeribacter arboris]